MKEAPLICHRPPAERLPDGSEAAQGKYGGTVELTLTPLNN